MSTQEILKLQDEILELAIEIEGKRMEVCILMHDATADVLSKKNWHNQAAEHQRTMVRLIGERRPAVVAAMERARGLARA